MSARHDRPKLPPPRASRTARRAVAILAAVLLISLGGTLAADSPDTTYDLSWWTADGGGAAFIQAGSYTLGGTAGQPDASTSASASAYTLQGGFWAGARSTYSIYLPLLLKRYP